MKIVKKKENYLLEIDSDVEKKEIEAFLFNSLEFKKINNDVFCFVKKKTEFYQKDITKKKIVQLLNDKNISVKDKVEGVFENFLNKKDLEIFKEMVSENEVIKFKLSPSYKKSIYKPNPKVFGFNNFEENFSESKKSNQVDKSKNNEAKNNSKNVSGKEFDLIVSDFKKNGFVIIENNLDASKFSSKFEEQIKNNLIYGIRSFDQRYYVIKKELFEEYKEKILESGISSDFLIDDLVKNLDLEKNGLIIVLELLKEEALVIEKRKGIYRFV